MDSKKDHSKQNESQSPGCVVTREDTPYVIASLSCCLIFIVYGACAASLGPALPAMSIQYNKSISEMGSTFTSRGVGYLLGTLLSAYILSFKNIPYSKEFMAAISEVICGIALFVVTKTSNFVFCIFLFFIQGISYGLIDTLTNCALPEMWGRRVGPWMQAMHSCFGIGAIIGPAIIGGFGYDLDFTLILFASFVPFLSIVVSNLFGLGNNKINSEETGEEGEGEGRQAPFSFKIIVSVFFFIYVGVETGYAGWIPSYALIENVTDSDSKAAYLSAMFWAALTIGRVVAIPSAIFLSSTTMIRIQLSLAVITGILSLSLLTISYSMASFVSGFAGFALSAMFPVMMTIFGDYGYKVDSNSTTMFIIGATMGESIIPVCIGFLMSAIDPYMMPVSIFVSVVILVALYLSFHFLSIKEQQDYKAIRIDDSEHSSLHPVLSKTNNNESPHSIYNPVSRGEAFTIEAEDDEEDLETGDVEEQNGIELKRFEIVDETQNDR